MLKNIIGLFLVCLTLSNSQLQAQETFAESLADQQLAAYNAMDLDAFLEVFADDVKIYDDLSKYNVTTKAEMKENYKAWFDSIDYLHCEILQRIAEGDTVVDFEEVTYSKAGEEKKKIRAFAIYRIRGNKISEVSFIRP